MMRQFLDKKQITKRKKIIQNIIGFGVFFILSAIGFLSLTGQFFNYVGRPIWEVEKSISSAFYNINYLFQTKASLSNENKRLTEENSNINLSMIDYQVLKTENDQLKETLGRVPTTDSFILGNILTKPNHSPYDTIIIDIGDNMKIKEGAQIYADGNVPIGIISKVYNNTSLVTLYTNPEQKTEGFIVKTCNIYI